MEIVYKHYANGVYQGDLNVTNPFSLSEQINTLGGEIVMRLAVGIEDTSTANDPVYIIDEDENIIATEDGDDIIAGTELLVSGFPNIGDNVKVYQYDSYNPSGKIIFDGKVMKWKGKYSDASIEVTVRSRSYDLDQYLISILPEEIIAEQTTYDSAYTIFGTFKTPIYDRLIAVYQTFTVPADTFINGVYLYLNKSSAGTGTNLPVQIRIFEGIPTSEGTLVATQTVIVSSETEALTFFQFSQSYTLAQGITYSLEVTNPNGGNLSETSLIELRYNSAGGYGDGQVYLLNDISGYSTDSTDLYFQLVSETGGVGNQFNSKSPSTIVRDLMDNYQALGGVTQYTDSSIENTATVVSYTFKFNTYFEGLKKAVQLAPANWYFYVDSSDLTLYFGRIPTTVSHTFTFGKEIIDLDIEYVLDETANVVYVVGAEQSNGTSLVVSDSDTDSIATYGQFLDVVIDNRLTNTSSAELIASNELRAKREPSFQVKVEISAEVYDISSIRIGQTVGFRNFKGLVNDLELQVVGKVYKVTSVILHLDTLPPQQNKRLEDIKRNLDSVQTKDTP